MPTEIIVNSCEFYNQLKSGQGFTSPTDPTNNLVGSVGERIKLVMEIGVAWYFRCSDANQLIVVNGVAPAITFTRQAGSWLTDGFYVGDNVSINGYIDFTINTITDTTINATITAGTMVDGTYTNSSIVVTGVTSLTALIYKFGLIGNSDIFTYASKISGNDQIYYAAGISPAGSPPPTVNMLALGNYEDWVSGKGDSITNASATVEYESQSLISNIIWQYFKIVHYFIINPFYLQQYEQNYIDGTIPDILAGLNSLKYAFECEFRTVLSNPNTSKIARVENNLGCVGWFDENFNGFDNLYEVESITYEDTTLMTSCDGLQTSARTTVTVTVNGSFTAGKPYGMIVYLCPDNTAYTNTINSNMEGNYLFDDAIVNEGAGWVNSNTNGIIVNTKIDIVGGQLVIKGQIEYTTLQQLQLNINSKYVIGVIVANDSLSSGNSDKVILLADYNTYVASADIPDLMYVTGFETYQHFVTDPTATTGTTKADIWNEDGLCFKFDFWLDLNLNALLNSLKFLVIAYDSTTGNYFILGQYAINLNNVIISGGVQQINIADTRGYKLNSSDYFNKVIVTTGANIGNKQYYQMYIGQKTPWQDWLQNLDVDTVFYNNAEPNNNLNYKSSNYSNLNNYQIKFALLANVYGTNSLGISGNTDYLILTPDFLTYDYDLPTTWTATLETFDETGTTNLGGSIRTDANTLFRITWVRSGAFNVGYNFWAIHRIEESNETGTDIYEFSSLITSINDNKLIPISGATYLDVNVIPSSNTVITECLIDFTKLEAGKTYKLSGRLDDGTAVPYTPVGKLTEDGTLKITEDGQIKIVE